ncbi:hypothetical protein [Labilibaculum euxinus]|uniref:Uncharacterized protein n=1 Tax=Labilibaculum euxinus TaxID=2686357 RepID=A0A7M4DA95_9BACT|nr:hypothetical protein [Labilibaculum euxinus]MUP39574.1 hypothetical protein [Labilibaculum euxinus]MVB08779.1 hypothetical protein [Labilibaculum euxinus]
MQSCGSGEEKNEATVLDIVLENIDTGTDLGIDLSAETMKIISYLQKIQNVTKNIPLNEIRERLPKLLSGVGKNKLLIMLSNTGFKKVLRDGGITKNSEIRELVQLKNTHSNNFFTDSRINKVSWGLDEKKLAKLIDDVPDLGIVDVVKNENNLTGSIFDKSFKLENISKTLEITGYVVDLAIAFKNIANGQNLEPADLLFMIPGAPELMKSIVNELSFESVIWENELPWSVVKTWNISDVNGKTEQEKFGVPGHLYLQYTQYKGRANVDVCPTSFVFLNSTIANEVFGFIPQYVNYNNEIGFKGEYFNPEAQSDKIIW